MPGGATWSNMVKMIVEIARNVMFSLRKSGEIREHVATLVENHEEIFETVDGNSFRET